MAKLKALEADGHEIACHGYEHKDATQYTTEEYMSQQVLPALQILEGFGFKITAFAYPFGNSTPALDSVLLSYFKVVRYATFNRDETTLTTTPKYTPTTITTAL